MALIALVTAAEAAHLDEDLPPLAGALTAAALDHEVVVWDDPTVDWRRFDLVVVRSAWDYAGRRDDFLDWADRVAAVTTLRNPLDILAWSTDKRYLLDLAAAGVPVTPTVVFEPGDEVVLPASMSGARDLVVKPVVGAGSIDAERFEPEHYPAAVAHAERLLAQGRAAMVQPYLHSVDTYGETALLFFGGVYSHAIRKGPILRTGGVELVDGGLFAAESITPREPTADERNVAGLALAAVPGGRERLLYVRVDLVLADDGQPVVLELEAAEPSVFLDHAPHAAERFVASIAAALPR
ncbi:MAG TPA: hypothetical protein VF855_01965 [Acidimicrobiales bacterium]